MHVAIITPYYKEPLDVLRRCNQSVKNQTYSCDHLFVADGHPLIQIEMMGAKQISLPASNGDYGDTPRYIGTVMAYAQGYDAVCWLDADNWLEPTHVEDMVRLSKSQGTPIVTATRNLRRKDGSLINVCNESDGKNFNDTNCYFLTREAMLVSTSWGFKEKKMSLVGDRLVWSHVTQRFPRRSHNPAPTVNYTTNIAMHYLQANEHPPADARVIQVDEKTGECTNRSYWELVDEHRKNNSVL